MTDDNPIDKRPTITELIESYFGITLPTIPIPQTLKNIDKALSVIVRAAGDNVTERMENSTKKIRVLGRIERRKIEEENERERKLGNRADIVQIALEDLSQAPGPDAQEEIEADWLNLFAKFAEDKSSEELKILFGRILAGEIRKPGTFSLRTLHFFSVLTRAEAESISNALSFSLDGKIIPYNPDRTAEPRPKLQTLMFDLGVVSSGSHQISALSLNFTVQPKKTLGIAGSKYGLLMSNESDTPIIFKVPGQPLTAIGREILKIASPPDTDLGFLKNIGQSIIVEVKAKYPTEFSQGHFKIGLGTIRSISESGIEAALLERIDEP